MKKILLAFTMLLAMVACTNTRGLHQSGHDLAQGAEEGFEVTAFDQVEDGSRYLPTAKKLKE